MWPDCRPVYPTANICRNRHRKLHRTESTASTIVDNQIFVSFRPDNNQLTSTTSTPTTATPPPTTPSTSTLKSHRRHASNSPTAVWSAASIYLNVVLWWRDHKRIIRWSQQLLWTVICLLLLTTEGAGAAEDNDEAEELLLPVNDSVSEVSPPPLPISKPCLENCTQVLEHSFCNQALGACQCLKSHPVFVNGTGCLKVRLLQETCNFDQQCQAYDLAAICSKLSDEDISVCTCKTGFFRDKEHNIPIKFKCFSDTGSSNQPANVPTIVSLLLCLTILLFLLCFMFKLFSRSRWARSRRFADANRTPPPSEIDGLDIEKQLYQPEELEPLTSGSGGSNTVGVPPTSINITVASPSSSILKGGSSTNLRRGSGNNNTNFEASLSGGTSRRSSGNVSFNASGVNSRRTSLQRIGLTVSGTDIKDSISRRGSSFNSHASRTAPASGSVSRRSSSNVSLRSRSGSRKASLARNGLTAELIQALKDLESGEGEIEQTITIVPNPRAKRRGSMASYAFPELHSRSIKNKQEPENLLILTRTRTDRHGRRHSVAVPLIPPPDGEKFEGGYHVERNPITGGATLVPPTSPFVRGRSSSERRRSVRETPSPAARQATAASTSTAAGGEPPKQATSGGKNLLGTPSSNVTCTTPTPKAQSLVPSLSTRRRPRNTSGSGSGGGMPIIGEIGGPNVNNMNRNNSVKFGRTKSLYVQRRRESQYIAASQAGAGRMGSVGRVDKKKLVIITPSKSSSTVPGADTRRRHSYQSGAAGASALARDMERLRVAGGEGGPPAGNVRPGVSPKPSKKRRASTRRSSRSGFLHFLDLAIAN